MTQPNMNEDVIRGKWNQIKGKVKEQFGELTDDDLMKANGSTDRMIGLLQERYGYGKERAQDEWSKFVERSNPDFAQQGAPKTHLDKDFADMAQQAQKVTQGALDQGKQIVDETVDTVKKRADSVLQEQKQQAVDKLEGVAGALRSSSEELRKNDLAGFADYANSAADYVEDFSHYVSKRNPFELWGEVQSFARRQPEVFVFGTLAAGFLLGRFLRSSASSAGPRTSSERQTTPRYQRANASSSSRRNAPEGQEIFIQGTTDDSYKDWQHYAREGGTQASQTPTPATFATPTRPEDRPEATRQS